MTLKILSMYFLILSLFYIIKFVLKIIIKIFNDDLSPLRIKWYEELLLFITSSYIVTYIITNSV
jgi:hypothetical protein